MKKLIILIIILFGITGCMGYVELNKIAIVQTILIDHYDDNYHITANIILDNDNNKEIIKVSGKSLEEAFNNSYQKFYKKLYITHNELVILTSNAVNNKLEEIIDYFINNTSIRHNFNLALSENKELDFDKLNEYLSIIEKETATIKNITFEDFIKNLYESNKSYLPVIINNNKVDGIYLIKNYKLYDKLEKEETIVYNYIANNIKSCEINNISVSDNSTIININSSVNITIKSKINKDNKEYEKILKDKINNLNNKYQDYDVFNFKNKKLNIKIQGDNEND